MKRTTLIILVLLATVGISYSQKTTGELVDWPSQKTYFTKSFQFKSDQLEYSFKDCRYLEIKSISGISGYLILGDATFNVKSKNLSGKSSAILMRLNPSDAQNFLNISDPAAIDDQGFKSLSLIILESIFKRSYHAGMNAIIPNPGDYAINIFSEKEGDTLINFYNGKIKVFDLTKKN